MTDARHFAVEDTLRDGTPVVIRAVRPDDRARIVTAFHQLDPHSVYTRFFGTKSDITDAELDRIDTMDFMRDVMLVVTTHKDGAEIVIAAGRYIAYDASDRARAAEIAFTVEEDYQGLGIAGRLLKHLIAIARRNGIARFDADVLAENKPMLAVFTRSGLPMERRREGGAWHVMLSLAPAPPASAA